MLGLARLKDRQTQTNVHTINKVKKGKQQVVSLRPNKVFGSHVFCPVFKKIYRLLPIPSHPKYLNLVLVDKIFKDENSKIVRSLSLFFDNQ